MITGEFTNTDISALISHHYSVLQHELMKIKVQKVTGLTKEVLGVELRCSDVLGNGLCYANTALVALGAATGHPMLRAIAGSIATLLAELNAWEDNALPNVF